MGDANECGTRSERNKGIAAKGMVEEKEIIWDHWAFGFCGFNVIC
jgi:hypothetical protein